MGNNMKRYIRQYFRMFKLSFMNEMTHRGNFLIWAVVHTTSFISMIVLFKIIYLGTSQIHGWSQYQAMLVLGVGTLVTGIGSLTFFPFMYSFGQDVQNGDLDLKLLKPLDVLFQSAFCWVDVEDIIVAPNAILLIVYSLWKLSPQNIIINLILFLILLLSSLIILFSVLTLIQSLTLKFIRVDYVAGFFWSLVNITKYPAKAITNIGRAGLILLVPVAVISSVPAEVLFGRYDWSWIIASLVFSLFLFWFSKKVFYSSLRHYSSASS